MTENNDWIDPQAATRPAVVGTGRIERQGLLSTARVGRDAAIAGVVVGAAVEVARSVGWVAADAIAANPNVLVLATSAVTIAVRFVWKWFGRYGV
jgi:hypothetical protein